MGSPISTSSAWTARDIEDFYQEIEKIGLEKMKLNIYPNDIQIVNAEQMLDAYAFNGMPVMYPHWSFGRDFIFNERAYQKGQQNLAYEMVINTDPCISYLMEENTTMMQVTVMAHACMGHNHFFKNNNLMRTWTDPKGILGYLNFAKEYIEDCENRYGIKEVEEVLSACHSLKMYGVDKYKRPQKLSLEESKRKLKERLEHQQKQVNEIWKTLPDMEDGWIPSDTNLDYDFFDLSKPNMEPQENIMYFLEKNAVGMKEWKREIIRIVRKIAQYFYPNYNTKLMNEGFATFCHYHIVYELYRKGLINEGFMLEFLKDHTSVIRQRGVTEEHYDGSLNPYNLGFNIFQDIKRICESPTAEDREWFPHLAGTDPIEGVQFAVKSFKDSTFIQQYLSPHLIRKMRLFEIEDHEELAEYYISDIHDDEGYKKIRRTLSEQYEVSTWLPDLHVADADLAGSRTLYLKSIVKDGRKLHDESVISVLKNVEFLWGYNVVLSVEDPDGKALAKFNI